MFSLAFVFRIIKAATKIIKNNCNSKYISEYDGKKLCSDIVKAAKEDKLFYSYSYAKFVFLVVFRRRLSKFHSSV